jgi:antitoxin YefM
MTIILVMTTIPLADAKARLSAVLDEVRDTHERVVITRNGRPEAVILAVSDLEALEETLNVLSTPGALDDIRQAEADIAAGEAVDADQLRRDLAARVDREHR